GHDREGGVEAARGHEHGAVSEEEVLDAPELAVGIHDGRLGLGSHACRAHYVGSGGEPGEGTPITARRLSDGAARYPAPCACTPGAGGWCPAHLADSSLEVGETGR